jgi:hypothetical protein
LYSRLGIGEEVSKKEKLDVLDMIIDVLCTHEIMLDDLMGRLESLCYKLEAASKGDDVQTTKEIIEKISDDPIRVIRMAEDPNPRRSLGSALE